ncbi:hypothetical protein ELH43_40860 [Rhizobium ruizarguesonis]|nr:hypothetical protein ELH43_40860 [Rhizobium ruizarguesonis]
MWSPFVLSKQTESQLADFTQLFFGQALRRHTSGYSGDTGRNFPCIESFEPMVANCLRGAATGRN